MQEFSIDKSDIGQRVDIFLANQFPEFTRSALSNLFGQAGILVNNTVSKAGYRLRNGDKIQIDTSMFFLKPPQLELPVIYEDNNVAVINKPAGVLTHAKGVLNTEATVASFLHSKINDKHLSGNRAGIVHRLDRDTSGVIIGAKNSATAIWLQKQFANRKVEKTYLAIVKGWLSEPAAKIEVPLARNPRRPQTFHADHSGKRAETTYKVIKKIEKRSGRYALIEMKPTTGRTHQLRVHMAYIGHPIIGDKIYGSGIIGPMMLHAKSLKLTLPDHKKHIFKAPLPARFSEFEKNA